ncbi:MAG: hypothetical protein JJ891_16175 [Rhizobiaceae bacterium]|jgi:hypothetical protein|nr:hypothetical protein [Rhizobiaceae bacterium]
MKKILLITFLLFSRYEASAQDQSYDAEQAYYLLNLCLGTQIEEYFFTGSDAETAVLAALPDCSDFIDMYSERLLIEASQEIGRSMSQEEKLNAKAQTVRRVYEKTLRTMTGKLKEDDNDAATSTE